jgi:hypothetical protein
MTSNVVLDNYFGNANPRGGGQVVSDVILLEGSATSRLWCGITLRAKIRRVKRQLARTGASHCRAFVVIPDLSAPIFIYELNSAASLYASRHLRLPTTGRRKLARAILRFVMGCDPSAGAVVIVGQTP